MASRSGAWSAAALAMLLAACGGSSSVSNAEPELGSPSPAVPNTPQASPGVSTSPSGGTPAPTTEPPTAGPALATDAPAGDTRPDWLGTRVLPERPDGLGEVQDTPPELLDRRFPPPDGSPVADELTASVGPIPEDVLARSTWDPACPVSRDELRYITMTFWGFDDQTYVGEMIVNSAVAGDVVEVFKRLYDARFPIEEMRVVDAPELDAPPTGDGNNTTAFVCRPTTLSDSWSEHAYGLAIDINPFHNPYVRGDAVLPELASAYLDRERDLPGMIAEGDAVTEAFAAIGWGWGGEWMSLKDWMHFSASGR